MSQRDYFEKDYYAALGVAKDASSGDISKAYRKLARELHPDARPDDAAAEARFKEVSEAYSVLSDPDKRKEYDQVREMVGSGVGGFGGFGGGFPGGGFPGGAGQTVNVEDLLSNLFGRAPGDAGPTFGRRTRTTAGGATRGRDVETDLTLSFDDALAGVTTTLRVAGRAPCSVCNGSGAKPGTMPKPCPQCGGAGVISNNQGLFGFSEPCPTCHGSGRVVPDPCTQCNGTGAEVRTREIRARIPAGVKDGARIRLKGKGEAGAYGGEAGDLFVNVHVQPHEVFGRRGDHLTLTLPVTIAEAALGADVRVPTLDGSVTVKIPAGTEPGRTLRVRGKGMTNGSGQRGDLLVTVEVVVPRSLKKVQRKMLEDLGRTLESPRKHLEAMADEETP